MRCLAMYFAQHSPYGKANCNCACSSQALDQRGFVVLLISDA